MPMLRVQTHRDEDLKPVSVEIWKGRKKLTVKYQYSPKGDVYGFTLEGRKELLPTFSDLVAMVDAKRIDRIGTIELIDLITKIEKISLIETIQTIGEITTIRDLILRRSTFILNGSFEQDLLGWYDKYGNSVIDEVVGGRFTKKSVRFDNVEGVEMYQIFPIPLGVDWLTELYFYLRSATTGTTLVKVYYRYTDGTTSDDTFNVATANNWEKRVMLPTAGKYMEVLTFVHSPAYPTCWIDDITTVF